MRGKRDGLVSTRKSRWYYVDGIDDVRLQAQLRSGPTGDGYYEHMLIEDSSHVLPFGRGLDEGFRAEVTGTDSTRAEILICDSLPTQFDRTHLADAVREFMQHTAQLIVGYESAIYEIDYLVDPADPKAPPVAFRFEPLQVGSVDRVRRRIVQYVPASMAEKVRRNGLGYVELERDRVVRFDLPKDIESDVRRSVRFLASASEQHRAEFALVEQSMRQRTDYDASEHHRMSGELLLEATRPIGWNARGLYRDHVLDPYSVWRQLQFKRFKIRLRDSILARLNEALIAVGGHLGFEAQVELLDVPTHADVDAAEADLRDGRRPLTDLIAAAY
ncbi:MAG: hypothetical protein QOE35_3555 [Actinomycetota bacterium]